jgi:hypothetical protein
MGVGKGSARQLMQNKGELWWRLYILWAIKLVVLQCTASAGQMSSVDTDGHGLSRR